LEISADIANLHIFVTPQLEGCYIHMNHCAIPCGNAEAAENCDVILPKESGIPFQGRLTIREW